MRRMPSQRPLSHNRRREHAEPGQVLKSNRELAMGKGFLFGDIGEVVPKGFEEPVRLYAVRWREEI